MAFEFKLPDIGEGLTEGEVVKWLVAEGDTVADDQPMVEVMTDKATVEIVAEASGALKILKPEGEVVPIGDKWKGGTLILKPGDPGLAEKEIPIDTFFHKIVMLRDRMRVLEQKINAHKTLEEQEKVELQQYITRIYGSLTTFNVLFKLKDQTFVGERSKS